MTRKKFKRKNKIKFEKLKIRVELRRPLRDGREILVKYMRVSALINYSAPNKSEDGRQERQK